MDGTLPDTITVGQRGYESKVNEGVRHPSQIPRSGASLQDKLWCLTQDTPLWKDVEPLCREFIQRILKPSDKTGVSS